MVSLSGRAPKQRAAEREATILAGARRVFAGASFAQADTAELAAAAGVKPAALYRYFPTKRDLYLATLRDAGPRLLALWRAARDEADDPAEALRNIGMAYYDHARGRSPVMRLWFQAVGEASDPEVREIVAGTLGEAVEVIASIIRAGQATGAFSGEVDARADAWRFMGIGLSMDVAAVLGFDADLTRETVQRWGDGFIDSLRARKEARNG
jgi:AcrR family transcriptional regulator